MTMSVAVVGETDRMARTRFVGTAGVGDWLGVSGPTVNQWLNRYAGTDNPCPEPDAEIPGARGSAYGWLPERKQEWRDWDARRTGQGAPGKSKPGSGRRRQAE